MIIGLSLFDCKHLQWKIRPDQIHLIFVFEIQNLKTSHEQKRFLIMISSGIVLFNIFLFHSANVIDCTIISDLSIDCFQQNCIVLTERRGHVFRFMKDVSVGGEN